LSLAKLGRRAEALGWLARAIDAGYSDAAHLDADVDLAAVREGEEWLAVRKRLSPKA